MRRQIGQLAFAGFAGHSIPQDLRLLAREFDLGGIILFARNVEAPEQVADLARDAQALAGRAAPLGQHGSGRRARRAPEEPVHRLAADADARPERRRGASPSDSRARWRRSCARSACRSTSPPSSTFSPTPGQSRHRRPRARANAPRTSRGSARAIIRTLQAEGIAACGKHFPGHGDTSADSHHELPVVEHPPDRIERVEWVPFKAAIDAGVASIMTAHILIPALDDRRPATLVAAHRRRRC